MVIVGVEPRDSACAGYRVEEPVYRENLDGLAATQSDFHDGPLNTEILDRVIRIQFAIGMRARCQ